MTLQALQTRGLNDSTILSRWYLKKMIAPIEVIRVLNANEISFVLVGLHGLIAWITEARGTKDVDIIVASKQVKKAVKVLLAAFPELEAADSKVVTRLKHRETGNILIDVMKPVQQPIRSVFKNNVSVEEEGQTYRIPTLAMGLVLKFAPLISLTRANEDKHQDAHDFILMVKHNKEINLETLAKLGDLIYNGGDEIVAKVHQVRSGEILRL